MPVQFKSSNAKRTRNVLIEALEQRQHFSSTMPVVGQPWTEQFYFHNNSGNFNATASEFQVTINWCDGSQTTTTNIVPEPGESQPEDFIATATHTYANAGAQDGDNTVIYTYTGPGGTYHTWEGSLQITVQDAPIVSVPMNIVAPSTGTYSGPVAEFTYDNPFATAANLMADVQYTDPITNQKLKGTISGSGGAYTVSVQNAHLEYLYTSPLQTSVFHMLSAASFGSCATIQNPVTLTTSTEIFAGNSNAVNTIDADAADLQKFYYDTYVEGDPEATAAFYTGLGNWANNTYKQLSAILQVMETPYGVNKLAGAIATGVGNFMTSDALQNQAGMAQTINKTIGNVAQQLQANPAQFIGETLPNVLIVLATSGGGAAAETAAATTALTDVAETGAIAGALKAEVSITESIGTTASRNAVAETTQAVEARAALGETVVPGGATIETAPIFVQGEEAVYAVGQSAVKIFGAGTNTSAGTISLLKNVLANVNQGIWNGENNFKAALNDLMQNCVDTASITGARLNQSLGGGKVPTLPTVAPPALTLGDSTILTGRFGQKFVSGTNLKTVLGNLTADNARAIATFAQNVVIDGVNATINHAIVIVDLGKDGLWFLDGQAQTAIKYGSATWIKTYGSVSTSPTGWGFMMLH